MESNLDLQSVYTNWQSNEKRIQNLIQQFELIYSQKPMNIARAPGRVNLIGEHIDYMGYAVLPFALDQDTLIAFSYEPSPQNSLSISHVDSQSYQQCEISGQQPFNENNPVYSKYIWAGFQAGLEYLQLNILVTGNVPMASGLSSSSSLTVASSLVGSIVSGQKDVFDKTFIEAIIWIKAERSLGTACGGMDQTISILATKGDALKIDFDPITVQNVNLPDNISFVICNSMTPSKKLESLGTRYNKRVSECRIAIALICKKLNIQQNFTQLKQFQVLQSATFEDLEKILKEHVQNKPLTVDEIENLLGFPLLDLIKDVTDYQSVLSVNKDFDPYQRLLHVIKESSRVLEFKDVCDNQNLSKNEKCVKLGQLMNESHFSCKNLYDCSSEQLDILTALCRKNGAYGSRLTGAGWGGCLVSIVEKSNVDQFINQIKAEYYDKLPQGDQFVMDEVIFQTSPSAGVKVFKI